LVLQDTELCTEVYPKLFQLLCKGLNIKFMILFTICTLGGSTKQDTTEAQKWLARVVAHYHSRLNQLSPNLITPNHPESQLQYLVYVLSHLRETEGWEPCDESQLQKPLHMLFGTILSSEARTASYMAAVLLAIKKVEDGASSSRNLSDLARLASQVLDTVAGGTRVVYPGKVQLSHTFFRKREQHSRPQPGLQKSEIQNKDLSSKPVQESQKRGQKYARKATREDKPDAAQGENKRRKKVR